MIGFGASGNQPLTVGQYVCILANKLSSATGARDLVNTNAVTNNKTAKRPRFATSVCRVAVAWKILATQSRRSCNQ